MPDLVKVNQKVIDETNQSIPTYYYDVVIANGATISDSFFVHGDNVIGVITPSGTFEPTSLTFEVSLDDTNWRALQDVTIVSAANQAYNLNPGEVHGWSHVRIVANSAPAADRTIQVIIKKV